MYNYSFDTTYQTIDGDLGDTKYREEMLKAFNMTEYEDEELKRKMDKLYNTIKDECNKHELIKSMKSKNQFPFVLDDNSTLIFFFSFDYFNLFHKCIQDFFKNGHFSDLNIVAFKKLFNK